MKKSKKIIIGLIVIILAIVIIYVLKYDVTRVNTVLVGESEHWKVSYAIKGYVEFHEKDGVLMSSSDGSYKLVLTYKGDLEEINDITSIGISGDSSGSALTSSEPMASSDFNFNGKPHMLTTIAVSQGKPLEYQITWDGKSGGQETITLKYNH